MNRFLPAACLAFAWLGCDKPAPSTSAPPRPAPAASSPAKVDSLELFLRKALEQHQNSQDLEVVETTSAAIQAYPSSAQAHGWRAIARALNAYYGFFTVRAGTRDVNREAATPWKFFPSARADAGRREASKRSQALLEMNRALGDAEKAVELDKVDELARLARGIVYLFRGDLDETENYARAIEDFSQALLLKSDFADARYYRAWASYKQAYETYARKSDIQTPPGFMNGEPHHSHFPMDRPDLEDLLRKAMEDWAAVRKAKAATWLVLRGGVDSRENSDRHGALSNLGEFFNQWDRHKKTLLVEKVRPLEPGVVFEQAKESVVLIEYAAGKTSYMGSGFVIGEGGELLTNAHVVAKAAQGQVTLRFIDQSKTAGTVIRTDSRRDLALVRIEGRKGKPLFVENPKSKLVQAGRGLYPNAEVGSRVVAIGHPIGLDWSMTSGIVSAYRTMNGVEMMQMDTTINHGNSGGPVLNLYGEIVGVATMGIADAPGLNFAVSGKEIRDFLQR